MPHIHTQYYGYPFTITRGDNLIEVNTMLVEITHRLDIESANQQLQTSIRRLATKDDMLAFCEKYRGSFHELFGNCRCLLSTHPDSPSYADFSNEILIPAMFFKGNVVTFGHVLTINFLIPGHRGMYVFLIERKRHQADLF